MAETVNYMPKVLLNNKAFPLLISQKNSGQKESIPHHHEVSSTGGSERGPTSPSSASTSQLILELDDSSSPETGGKR